jgi:uncharacterized membrane protein HdeD (DUF308 family)
MPNGLQEGLEQVRRHWGWYLALGVLLMVLGVIAVGFPLLTELATMVFFGWLLIISGIAQGILAFQVRNWGGFFLHLLGAILEVVVGVLVLRAPVQAILVITLLLAAYLLVGGLFRLTAPLLMRLPGAGLIALGGFISVLLGIMVASEWPSSALWFIGICVGVDLIFHGASWVSFALAARRLPTLPPGATPPPTP